MTYNVVYRQKRDDLTGGVFFRNSACGNGFYRLRERSVFDNGADANTVRNDYAQRFPNLDFFVVPQVGVRSGELSPSYKRNRR